MDALGEAASGFAGEVQSVLADVLPLECELLVMAEELNGRYVIRPRVGGQGGANVPLHVGQVRVGGLALFFRCQWDHQGKYLAVEESQFALNWGAIKDPLLRLHFRRDPRSKPASHWHVHAERGAFSALLARSDVSNPHSLADLHLPVGGSRMRPALEDFLQFLIAECGIDGQDGWRARLAKEREVWRRRQVAAIVRDAPDEVLRVLRENGYDVAPPAGGEMEPRPEQLRRW